MNASDTAAAALERRQAQRLAAQLLSGPPAEDTAAVARGLLAVQAQDPRGARLAVRARSRVRSAADVDAALTRDRSVVVTWLNRGTLHLVPAEDYWWLHPLTTPPLLRGNARRLTQEGVPPADAERGVAVIERAVTAEGPLTRVQLAERIAAAGVRTEGQVIVHLLALASLRGRIVRGPMADRDDGLADLAGRHDECPLPPPRLLGAYDPLLLGWDSRDPVVGPHGRLIAINGLFRPFALVRGRAVGTWSLPGGRVALAPFGPLPGADAAALAADAAEVDRFLHVS